MNKLDANGFAKSVSLAFDDEEKSAEGVALHSVDVLPTIPRFGSQLNFKAFTVEQLCDKFLKPSRMQAVQQVIVSK